MRQGPGDPTVEDMAAPVVAPGQKALMKNADGYEEVAARVKPSAAAMWDVPSGQIVDVLDEWADCEFKGKRGFIKAKNLPGAKDLAPGSAAEVKDSFPANKETCMRRHAEQDSTKGNVLCYVPNGPGKVTLLDVWVEFKWRGHRGFCKARHITHADAAAIAAAEAAAAAAKARAPAAAARGGAANPRGGAAASSSSSGAAAAPAAGGDPSASSSSAAPAPAVPKEENHADAAGENGEPPAKKQKVGEDGAAVAAGGADAPAAEPAGAAETAAPAAEGAAAAAAPEAAPAAAPAAVPAAAPAPVEAAPAAPAADDGVPTRDCDCCFDQVKTNLGSFCPGKEHFFCSLCLTQFLTAFKTADYAEQKKGKGRALCPMKDSETPFSDGSLVAFVPQDVFDEYLQIRIKIAEKGIQEQMEKENADKIAELKDKLAKATGDAEQNELDKHRLKIIDDIFTLKCPRCSLAFLDYDNCSAITCQGCSCGFCSYCLEDCGKDAHQHFYKNKSKCPKEGGPLFIDHKNWTAYQGKRKARMVRTYLAKVPEGMRKKLADLVAPDAKDLGIEMPEDLAGEALEPEAHGFQTLKLSVPRKLRAHLALQVKEVKKGGVTLEIPKDPKAAQVCAVGGAAMVQLKKAPLVKAGKNVVCNMPDDTLVEIDDEWLEFKAPKEKIPHGWIKAKHCVGRPQIGAEIEVRDAGGHGSVLVRKEAKQEEGANALRFIKDGTMVKVVQHWIEVIFKAHFGGPKKGFCEAQLVPENDIRLQGKAEDNDKAVKKLEEALGVPVFPEVVAGAAVIDAAGKGKGRGRGRGRGRG